MKILTAILDAIVPKQKLYTFEMVHLGTRERDEIKVKAYSEIDARRHAIVLAPPGFIVGHKHATAIERIAG